MITHIELLLHTLSSQLTTVFVAGLWQGTLAIVVAAALVRVVPKVRTAIHYGFSSIAFFVLAVLPWIRLTPMGAARIRGIGISPHVAEAIGVLWLTAAFVRSVQLGRAYCHLRKVWRGAVPLTRASDFVAPAAKAERGVVLCSSSDVDSPTVLGFHHPRLLLPNWMVSTLDTSDLQQIILHEYEHLRRRDNWTNLLQHVVLLLCPLHPGLLWLDGFLHRERELACDAGVIARTGQPIVYATCLTRLAEQRQERRGRLRLALAAWERRSELTHRVHAVLSRGASHQPLQSRLATGLLSMLLAAGSFLMTRVPQLVSVEGTGTKVPARDFARNVIPQSAISQHAFAPQIARVADDHAVPGYVAAAFRQSTHKVRHRRQIAAVSPALPEQTRTDGQALQLVGFTDPSLQSSEEQPARVMTMEFVRPYAAVPLGDGWLFLQL